MVGFYCNDDYKEWNDNYKESKSVQDGSSRGGVGGVILGLEALFRGGENPRVFIKRSYSFDDILNWDFTFVK